MKIVLLAGQAEHGKTESSKILTEYFKEQGKQCITFSFGSPLKDFCGKYRGWNGEKDSAGRTILQREGEFARIHNPDTWVNIILELIKAYGSLYDYVFIDDFRYPNEYFRFVDEWMYPYTIKVVRENFENRLNEGQRNHHSETSLSDFPFNSVILVQNNWLHLHDTLIDLVDEVEL